MRRAAAHPKARVIAPLRVLRREADEFLLLTEPELGEQSPRRTAADAVRREGADRARTARVMACSWRRRDRRRTARRRRGRRRGVRTLAHRSGIPRWGREIDESILPAEAGLDESHISFTKGCYPGQEPIARQRYRGKVNRRLRVLAIEGGVEPGDELLYEDKKVGRVTSAAGELALGFVRVEVPDDARLAAGGGHARVRPA